MMRVLSITVCAMFASANLSPAAAQSQTDASTIRAGHNIAVTRCIACHVVSPKQTLSPVLGPGIPSFEEIANRPGIAAASLAGSMKTARWHDYAMPAKLLPMSRISDTERAQVAAYILSLRSLH